MRSARGARRATGPARGPVMGRAGRGNDGGWRPWRGRGSVVEGRGGAGRVAGSRMQRGYPPAFAHAAGRAGAGGGGGGVGRAAGTAMAVSAPYWAKMATRDHRRAAQSQPARTGRMPSPGSVTRASPRCANEESAQGGELDNMPTRPPWQRPLGSGDKILPTWWAATSASRRKGARRRVATRRAAERVTRAKVRQLLDNEWLHLFRLDDDAAVWRYRPGGEWLQ